jgi:sporulation protein YlmC with PRC-barrel domain
MPAGAVQGRRPEMVTHRPLAEWHGRKLVDRDGEKTGKLEDVYVDVETDEPAFGTVTGASSVAT